MNMAVEYQRERGARHGRAREDARSIPGIAAAPKVRSRSAAVTARRMMAMVVACSMLFCVLVGLVYIKCLVAETQLAINAIGEKTHDATNEQTRLKEKLERISSVQVITARAAEMGMAQPAASQILYVHFPEEISGEPMALENGK